VSSHNPEPSDQAAEESVEEKQEEYVPAVMRLRKWAGPWIKELLAPERAIRRRWWWNRLFVQIDDPFFFENESEESIYEWLRSASGRPAGVLADARQVFDDEQARSENVQQRASGLQGAVAIAASFVLAGGGLLLNASELPHDAWRVVIALAYAYTVFCLVATGLRALRATVRTHAFHWPDPEGPVRRAKRSEADDELLQAAELLHSFSRNQPFVDYQLAQMRAAGHWFAGALLGVLVTGLLVCGALLSETSGSKTQDRQVVVAHAFPMLTQRPSFSRVTPVH
jgi:hypothetical protein